MLENLEQLVALTACFVCMLFIQNVVKVTCLQQQAVKVVVMVAMTCDSGDIDDGAKNHRDLEDFEEYATKAKTLPDTTTNENLLVLYGLYKQATVGPVNTDRPGMFSMRERAKWDAWKAVEAKSKDEAMNDYITKVKQLLEEAGLPA
ncbi:hypothetical protein E3N88_30799 [Mikania micrantha]|uniref:ACB domain-containing protein n=1 Tax=Mikania micrantha TaxID=192012 RepID=A0A5N6MMM8_9ASTR|nr:hypothetical protein E3N88_30799 [Mikania micrantha]